MPRTTTHAEEQALVAGALAGSEAAKTALLDSLATHLHHEARHYSGGGRFASEEDLVHEGVVAVLTHLPDFDPSRGLRLWTFVRMRVREAMSNHRAVLAGVEPTAMRRYRMAMRENETLAAAAEYAHKRWRMSVSTFHEAHAALAGTVSYSAPGPDGQVWEPPPSSCSNVGPSAPPPVGAAHETRTLAHIGFAALEDERQRIVVRRLFLADHPATYEEVAEELGTSTSSVKRLRAQSLQLMRDALA